jgi:predicted nicotinamide N-methyase
MTGRAHEEPRTGSAARRDADEAFLLRHTSVGATALVPQIALHTGEGIEQLWERAQELARRLGDPGGPAAVGPPFWAFPWAGGQVIARYVLDHPAEVRGRTVLDVATGSGLCALAAARAGAAAVTAADIDPMCATAVAHNAALQPDRPRIDVVIGDAFAAPPPPVQVVLAGDVWYDRALAARALPWLRAAHDQGSRVLIGDPGRDFLPPQGWTVLQRYDVPVPKALEGRATMIARVATFAARGAGPPGAAETLRPADPAAGPGPGSARGPGRRR